MQTQYVFIAGGVGITPFRSMIKYLIDKNISASITLFYITRNKDEFIFKDLLDKANDQLNLKTIYVLSHASAEWKGEKGDIDEAMISKYIKDVLSPIYFISGPQAMVEAYRTMLQKMNINIVPKARRVALKDFFFDRTYGHT